MKKKIFILFSMILLSVLVMSGCSKSSQTVTLDEAMYPAPLKLGNRSTKPGGNAVDYVNQNELSYLEVSGKVDYQEIQSMLDRINGFRQDKGISQIKINQDLMGAAATRVAETTLCYSHLRPDGSAPSSCNENIEAEVIGAGKDAKTVFESWIQKSANSNLLASGEFNSIGIANFGNQGSNTFWVILLSRKKAKKANINQNNKDVSVNIAYDPEFCPVEFVLKEEQSNASWEEAAVLGLNQQINLQAVISPYFPNLKETETGTGTAVIAPKQLKWLTANSNVALVNNGTVISQSNGKTVVDAVFGSYIGAKKIYSGNYNSKAKIETVSAPTFQTKKFNVYGHRGFSGRYPENSILSFKKAAECNAFDGMENDVHTTSDGQILVMHDDTLNRMTGMNGKISNITYDESKKIRLNSGSGYSNELKGKLTIPTLTEYLDICYRYQKIAMIELKEFSDYEKDVPALVAYLNDYKNGWFKTHTIFISFDTELLNAVANCTNAYSLEIMPRGKTITLEQAKDLYSQVLKGRKEDFTLIFRPSVGQLYKSGIDQFKNNGIQLDCWGLKTGDKNRFEQLQKDGVLGITLDSPEGLGLDMSVSDPIME